jgi:4-amino-4-deoxy-L-arabinose transferase-like glycosyltransferase
MRGRAWAIVGLVGVLAFDVWWRCHTVGPTLRDRLGVDLYLVTGREAEPLDCDEAIYAYIGKRIARGAVMYRDLTENKPPLGYWLFALAVAVGGAEELTVRLMPVPIVLGTVALVWWLGLRLRGPGAAVLAAATYAVLSTDPFLYGNGNQMEQMINLFATASLALLVAGWNRPGRALLVAAGASLGAAALVKQVAAAHGPVFALALLLRCAGVRSRAPRTRGSSGATALVKQVAAAHGPASALALLLRQEEGPPEAVRTPVDRVLDVLALASGFAAVCAGSAAVLVAQGAGREAFDDVFRYGPALAADTPPDPHAPPLLIRWFTGNADPNGHLPPPFGTTDYLVWWGTGSWPVWLAGVPALAWLLFGPGSNAPRRLVALWTLSAWVQVALPRLFWAHYYLLPVPGLSVAVAVFLVDMVVLARSRRLLAALAALAVAAGLVWTARLQVVEYIQVAPEELTIRDKGGRQWATLRALGRDLARRSTVWPRPTLFVWGWQSPLFFYSGFDSVTPQVFADDLIKTFADGDHAQVRPRVERTIGDLRASPPSLIFCGYPPFPSLRAFLEERYLPSRLVPAAPDGRGLWVEREKYGAFETNDPPPLRPSTPPARAGRSPEGSGHGGRP